MTNSPQTEKHLWASCL